MISKQDNILNLYYIEFLAFLRILPFSVNRKIGRIKVSASFSKFMALFLYMLLVQCEIIYSAVLAYRKFSADPAKALLTASMDYVFIVCIEMCLYTAVMNFVVYAGTACKIFNGCMIDDGEISRKTTIKWLPWFKFGFIDFIAIVLPIAGVLFALAFSVVCVLVRTLPATAGVPVPLHIGAVILDFVSTFCWVSWIYFAILLQTIFIEKVSYVLNREIAAAK